MEETRGGVREETTRLFFVPFMQPQAETCVVNVEDIDEAVYCRNINVFCDLHDNGRGHNPDRAYIIPPSGNESDIVCV